MKNSIIGTLIAAGALAATPALAQDAMQETPASPTTPRAMSSNPGSHRVSTNDSPACG